MKKINTFLMALLVLATFACGNNMSGEQQNEDETTQGASNTQAETASVDMGKVLEGYMGIKNALVSGDGGTAKLEASKLSGKLEGSPMQALADAVKDAETIAAQRTEFSALSEALFKYLQEKGGNTATVYQQYCPMAFDNKGAAWLSEDAEIKNPYFGDEMLSCGEVKATIAAK